MLCLNIICKHFRHCPLSHNLIFSLSPFSLSLSLSLFYLISKSFVCEQLKDFYLCMEKGRGQWTMNFSLPIFNYIISNFVTSRFHYWFVSYCSPSGFSVINCREFGKIGLFISLFLKVFNDIFLIVGLTTFGAFIYFWLTGSLSWVSKCYTQ